jgi:Predicted membrane protein (DUF2127)
MQRPTGVSVLAVLNYIGGGFLVLCALLFFAGGAMLGTVLRSSMPGGIAAAAGAVIGVIFLIFAALSLATGYGLWTLKGWGRMLLIVLVALGLVMNVVGLASSFAFFRIGLFIWRLIVIAIQALILWYMFQPEVKRAFGEGAPMAAATP